MFTAYRYTYRFLHRLHIDPYTIHRLCLAMRVYSFNMHGPEN